MENEGHTPTPWKIGDYLFKGVGYCMIESNETTIAEEVRNKDANFIIEACNNYDRLQKENAELKAQVEKLEIERANQQQRGDWFESEFNRMTSNKKYEDESLKERDELLERALKIIETVPFAETWANDYTKLKSK